MKLAFLIPLAIAFACASRPTAQPGDAPPASPPPLPSAPARPPAAQGWWTNPDACPEGTALRGAATGRAVFCQEAQGRRNGPYTSFYRGGDKLCEGTFADDARVGTWTCFYPGGKKRSVGDYDGGRHGQWSQWTSDGSVIAVEHYTHGKLESVDKTPGADPGDTTDIARRNLAGARAYNESGGWIGTLPTRAAWLATHQYDTWWEIKRMREHFEETYWIEQKSLIPASEPEGLGRAPTVPRTADAARCRADGLCEVTARKGRPFPVGTGAGVTPKADLRLHRLFEVCRYGPAYRIDSPDGKPISLDPGALTYRTAAGPIVALRADVRITADGKPVDPPDCPKRPGNPRRTIIGSSSPVPIMGLFVISPKNARRVGAEQRTSSKAAFLLAKRLAAKKWTYSDRFCDDAVRQVMMIGVDGTGGNERFSTWRKLTVKDFMAKHWEAVVVRHAMMFDEYAPAECERAVQRMVEARRLAGKRHLEILHFGY